MITLSVRVKLTAPVCHSLKDKRMIVRSIIDKTHRKFNVAVAEVDAQDACQSIVLGAAAVSSSLSHAQKVLDEVVRFIENNTEAEIINVDFY